MRAARHANRSKQAGRHNRDCPLIVDQCAYVIPKHNANIVKEDFYFGMTGNQVLSHFADALRILYAEFGASIPRFSCTTAVRLLFRHPEIMIWFPHL